MNRIYQDDILNAGRKQVVISNDRMEVIIVPEIGGRIADIQSGGTKFLYRTYPNSMRFGPYTEHGGIEECMGSAPGTLWNIKWDWEQKDNGVLLQALSKGILVRKFITLDETDPIVKIEYSFFNLGDTPSKFTFGIHPEICVGGNLRANRYYIPSERELVDGGYGGPGYKRNVMPSEGWCAVTCEGNAFGQMFPKGTIDAVEIYYPRVNTHMVLQPMIFNAGVSPGKFASFTYMIYAGEGDAERMREVRTKRDVEFVTKYETFDESEIPKSMKEKFKVEAQPKRAFPEVPIPPIPDVGAIVESALRDVTKTIDESLKVKIPDISRPARTEVEEPVKRADKLFGKAISIEHVKGDITIQGWEQPHIDYTINGVVREDKEVVKHEIHHFPFPPFLAVREDEDVVKFETMGDLWLNVPQTVSEIGINFVNASVFVSGIGAGLKISGVNGKVEVNAKVPDEGVFDISLIRGDIELKIPEDTSCRISATNVGGEIITGDLPLQEEERTKTHLTGTLNKGTAKILLNVIKGKISIQTTK